METAEIITDKTKCASTRQCVSVAPGMFGIDQADGRVKVLTPHVQSDDIDLADEAVESCPVQALRLQLADR
ncbi:ferredoxin [Microbacterium sp. CPCC 204701]|uniref:ferredoxin n=1 Tax=Microbacterium sp. CPCC 204701 TaxID=2493084 RepID=UPI000FDA6B8D|nr:ferredoxin [Microbacterium sp. CPCC 204701]